MQAVAARSVEPGQSWAYRDHMTVAQADLARDLIAAGCSDELVGRALRMRADEITSFRFRNGLGRVRRRGTRIGLTPTQREALEFVGRYMKRHGGVSPSYDEIAVGLGLRSKSNVHRIVKALAARGHITVVPGGQRAISLVSSSCPQCRGAL